jgi:hypothetical protein
MNALKLFIAALILFASLLTRAQDIITFKNGDEVKAKISEIGLTEIKYKRIDNPNGPLYTVSKASVFMIKYENGTKDVFPLASPEESPDTYDGYKRSQDDVYRKDTRGDYESLMHKYRTNLAGGIVLTALGVPMIPIGLGLTIGGIAVNNANYNNYGNNYGNNYNNAGAPFIVSGVLILAAGIAMTIAGPIKITRARHYKAKAKEIGPSMSFAPVMAPGLGGQAMKAGAGLRINF